MKTVGAIFIILHGLVHLLYFGQSQRYFELKPGLQWPDRSWFLSRIQSEKMNRLQAGVFCIIGAIVLVISGFSLWWGKVWWTNITIIGLLFSSFIFLLFWNGKLKNLAEQGAYALLINLVILIVIYL
ncbi:hypothetical protein WJR50_30405 [Catalinimonas sp. 4WD22]|uniref:hypothetical protein n=1 Tax=Catalinimonas locisalis TaxID=3133978 RepID=UPI003101A30D